MPALGQVLAAFRDALEVDVRHRQHLLDRLPGQLLQRERVGVRVHGAAHQQVGADLAPGLLGHGLVDAQLVEASAALEVEVEQHVHDDVAGGGHEGAVPGQAVAVHRLRAAARREESRGEADVLHRHEGRPGDVGTAGLIAVGTVVQHRHPVGDQLDVAELLGRDAGDDRHRTAAASTSMRKLKLWNM